MVYTAVFEGTIPALANQSYVGKDLYSETACAKYGSTPSVVDVLESPKHCGSRVLIHVPC